MSGVLVHTAVVEDIKRGLGKDAPRRTVPAATTARRKGPATLSSVPVRVCFKKILLSFFIARVIYSGTYILGRETLLEGKIRRVFFKDCSNFQLT